MKKFILAAVAFAALSIHADAKWYVGGNAGIGMGIAPSFSLSYQIIPEFGYDFNKTFAVGGQLRLLGTNSPDFRVTATPYFRWKFAHVGPVTFFADTYADLGAKIHGHSAAFAWGFGFAPGFMADMNKHLSLISRIADISVTGVSNSASFGLNILTSASIGILYRF